MKSNFTTLSKSVRVASPCVMSAFAGTCAPRTGSVPVELRLERIDQEGAVWYAPLCDVRRRHKMSVRLRLAAPLRGALIP